MKIFEHSDLPFKKEGSVIWASVDVIAYDELGGLHIVWYNFNTKNWCYECDPNDEILPPFRWMYAPNELTNKEDAA